MFEVHVHAKEGPYLKWVDGRPKTRGQWVKVGHFKDKEIEYSLEINRQFGLEVMIDEDGYYRALVLKD